MNRRGFIRTSFLSLSCIPVLGVIFKPKTKTDYVTPSEYQAIMRLSNNHIQSFQKECFERGVFPKMVIMMGDK